MTENSAVNDNTTTEDRSVDALLGQALRHRREELGLSPAALSRSVMLPVSDLEHYERGDWRIPSLVLVRLADALDAPLDHFLKAI